jgi:hypothetical protein
MKKSIFRLTTCIALLSTISLDVQGATRLTVDPANPYEQPKLIRASCYTSSEGAITYSGQSVRPGIIAGPKEWLGSVALLYTYEKTEDGQCIPDEFLGFYEVLDTGAGMDTDGDGKGDSIKKGQSIDIFMPSLEDAYDFRDEHGDYLMIYLVRADG